jgi:hypothetical protein
MNSTYALTTEERQRLMADGKILAQAAAPKEEASRTSWNGKYRKNLHERQKKALARLHARTPLAAPTDLPATQT